MDDMSRKPNALDLHIPKPRARPGDKPDFSGWSFPEPGATPKPDIDESAVEMRDYAYGLIRVLDMEGNALGPWTPSISPEELRRGLKYMLLTRAFDELRCDEVVVKPIIGASAWRQARVRRGAALPAADELPLERCLIQPYLPAVAEEGEYSFLFFGGEFSHCAQKVPARGDYRVQSRFGAKEHVYAPNADELALARRVLAAAKEELLYARVDMVRGLDGALAVMELELIEPYLYPEQGPQMGELFADALVRLSENTVP